MQSIFWIFLPRRVSQVTPVLYVFRFVIGFEGTQPFFPLLELFFIIFICVSVLVCIIIHPLFVSIPCRNMSVSMLSSHHFYYQVDDMKEEVESYKLIRNHLEQEIQVLTDRIHMVENAAESLIAEDSSLGEGSSEKPR